MSLFSHGTVIEKLLATGFELKAFAPPPCLAPTATRFTAVGNGMCSSHTESMKGLSGGLPEANTSSLRSTPTQTRNTGAIGGPDSRADESARSLYGRDDERLSVMASATSFSGQYRGTRNTSEKPTTYEACKKRFPQRVARMHFPALEE